MSLLGLNTLLLFEKEVFKCDINFYVSQNYLDIPCVSSYHGGHKQTAIVNFDLKQAGAGQCKAEDFTWIVWLTE